MERYKEKKIDFFMVFIDLEKSYNLACGKRCFLEKVQVFSRYIDVIKICDRTITRMRTK